jgi:hypothetical protein
LICGIIQSIIKNYASVINLTGSLAELKRRLKWSVHLVRASSNKAQAQATSNKLIRLKLQRLKLQAASVKSQAARFKLQAASIKLLDILPLIKFYLVKGEGLNHDKCILRMITMK